jgi:hypothetical protein
VALSLSGARLLVGRFLAAGVSHSAQVVAFELAEPDAVLGVGDVEVKHGPHEGEAAGLAGEAADHLGTAFDLGERPFEQLDALLAEARAGGRVVDLEIEGEHRPLAAGVELAAYRVVQHALVAVGGVRDEPVTVQVRCLPDELELEVRGLRPDGSASEAALLAARERVSALGGSFSAEAPSPGRRALRARLPAVPAGA